VAATVTRVFDRIYLDTKARVVDLARGLTEEQLAAVVAGTPAWTGRDVVAHLVGVASDIVNGRLENAPMPEWTEPQVSSRRGRSLDELVAEWDEAAPAVATRLAERTVSLPTVFDALTHEADLREAFGVGRPPERDVDAVARALAKGVVGHFAGPGTLVVRTGDAEWSGGHGEPRFELDVEPYELFRGLLSRRSRKQMRGWRWAGAGDPDELIEKLPVFGARDDDQPVPV
jgi:uncharacterized protein (TIGR03083 family)